MIDFSSTLKDHSKENESTLNNNNPNDKSINASIISDTSPVYLFCTSKNGINSKNENGWTPIYRSIIANNLIALNELLNLGSDPNIGNNLGETPLYLCVDIDNYDALIILLQYNADTNIAKRNGTTPLHLAAKKNKYNFMHALLRNKANPNLPNKLYSQTATHIAIINKVNEEMLNIFHEYNADIYNIKDRYNKTPFDYGKELKDEEYVQLLINIFGDKNDNNPKESKTLIIKISDEIEKNNDKILNIPQNFHNSNYNILPEKILINQNEDYENKKLEFKVETHINNKENINSNINNSIIENKNKKTEKFGILSSGDPLYSDRTISKISETSKTKKGINSAENTINNLNNNNNLTEFQPIAINTEHNEIKHKNSLSKSLKNNINIDTKMIDNSKDIIILNNDNNELNNINYKDKNNTSIEKKEKIDFKYELKSENNKLNYKNLENKLNGISESNEDSKLKNDTINRDKEIIKNIISSTVKKIKVYTNTFNSDSSQNNNSITQKNVSNSKNEVLKLINFSSNSNINKENNEQKLSNNTNLDNFTNLNSQNGTSSFILYNSKKSDSDNEHKNDILTQNQISEITPISIKKIDTQLTHTENSNIFSELNNFVNNNINDMNKTEEEITNKDILQLKEEEKNIEEKINNIDIDNNNLNNDNQEDKENIKNKNQLTNNSCDNYVYDGSFEYSKSKSYLPELSLNNNQNQSNKKFSNSNITNNFLINQNHRQISYHNNKSSINKRKKEEDIQNDDSYNISINKENENQNNNEIIYYNKNYLAKNNSTKKEQTVIEPKNTVIQKNISKKIHTQSDLNNDMNIQRYNSITNKTNTINQKRFTYTSPNIKKNDYLLNSNLNKNNDKENVDINNNVNNNTILKTNPNVNSSNLNGTKEGFLSNNNNLSSFLNTNKLETIKDKQNNNLKENHNKNNSTFSVYDDNAEIKNLEKKGELNEENKNDNDNDNDNNNNNSNKDNNKNSLKNDNKLRNNIRRSSMGNTTLSSLTNNLINPGKKSIYSTSNNILNSSRIIFTGRNSNFNNNTNQSYNLIKNIPMNMLLRLRDWLISCDLLCYYNVLIENNMYDIDKCINELQNNRLTISYKDIEDLGIRKPGHIFRLLLKLEIDSGIIDNNLFNYILSKFNMSSSISNNIILTNSISDINCCGICNKNNNYQSYIKRNDCPYNDIFSFLKYKDLWKYKENFLHNGFDQLEYILLQLFSRYAFDKEIMNDCFHIYNDKDKLDVLNKLYQEKNNIAIECGIENDEKEIDNILSNNTYSSKYSSKKKKTNIASENNTKDNNENNCCNIF